MEFNTKAKRIILLAITIIVILLIVNIGMIIRINQLKFEHKKLTEQINEQNQTISQYENSSSGEIDESANQN